jgi:predicted MFS family arabinose efflux permease
MTGAAHGVTDLVSPTRFVPVQLVPPHHTIGALTVRAGILPVDEAPLTVPTRPQIPPPPDPPRRSPLHALRHPHFRTIWLAAFGSYVGNWFEFVAIGWLLSQETRSEAWMGIRAAAHLCPTFILGMWGGIVADSVNRRSLLVVTQVAMMVIALGLAASVFAGVANRYVLVAFALAQGITIAFNMPAWQVLTPRLVPREDLTNAITLNGISFNIARVVGPAMAGAIMRTFREPRATLIVGTGAASVIAREGSTRGASALLVANAFTFLMVMLAVLRTPDAPASPQMRGAWKHPRIIWTRSREAVAWVWMRRGPRAVFLAIVVYALFATPIMQLMPLLVSEVYGAREDGFGLLLAMMGLGAVVGGLGMRLVPPWYPMHHFIPLSITLGGLSILCFALAPALHWAMFIMFFVGIFWMWGFNSTAATMQHLVDDAMRGRVSAVVNTIAMGLMPLGTLLAAVIGDAGQKALSAVHPDWVGPGTATQLGLAGVAVILVLAGAVMLTWRTPEVDGLTPEQPLGRVRPGLWRGITAGAHRPTR